jgi:uncharacterized membrane protein YkoI
VEAGKKLNSGGGLEVSHRPLSAPLVTALIFGFCGMSARGASNDQDAARRALELGEIKPFDQILANVKSSLTGNIVSVEIDHSGPAWGYELRVLDRDGRIRRVRVDAKSGRILRIESD